MSTSNATPVSKTQRDSLNSAVAGESGLGSIGGLNVCRVLSEIRESCSRPTFADLGSQLTFPRLVKQEDGTTATEQVGRSESWISRRLGKNGALNYAKSICDIPADAESCTNIVGAWTTEQHATFMSRLHGKSVVHATSGAAGKKTGARKSARSWQELCGAVARKGLDDSASRADMLAELDRAITAAESQSEESRGSGAGESAAESVVEQEAEALASFLSTFGS